jgi:hypothetical protein
MGQGSLGAHGLIAEAFFFNHPAAPPGKSSFTT